MFYLDFYKLAFLREELIKFISIEYRNEYKEIDDIINQEIDRMIINNFRF